MNRRQFIVGALSLPMALRLSPAALADGTPVVLVTADTQSRVAVVDLTRGVILRSIETAPGPRSIETVSGIVAVVCHTAHGQVSLIDGPSLRVRQVLQGFGEPRYTAAAPNGRHAFVTDSGRQEVLTVDMARGEVVGRVAVGGGPGTFPSIRPAEPCGSRSARRRSASPSWISPDPRPRACCTSCARPS